MTLYSSESLVNPRIQATMLRFLDEAIAADSTYRLARMNKAQLLMDFGRPFEAIAVVEEWLREHPDDYQMQFALSIYQTRVGRQDLADSTTQRMLAEVEEHLALDPNSVVLQGERAFHLIRLGRREEGLRIADSLLALYPDSAMVEQLHQSLVALDSTYQQLR